MDLPLSFGKTQFLFGPLCVELHYTTFEEKDILRQNVKYIFLIGPKIAELQKLFWKRQTFKKATLKAELAFAYEVQKVVSTKVVYWVVLVCQNS